MGQQNTQQTRIKTVSILEQASHASSTEPISDTVVWTTEDEIVVAAGLSMLFSLFFVK
jgi:hypothetical protein